MLSVPSLLRRLAGAHVRSALLADHDGPPAERAAAKRTPNDEGGEGVEGRWRIVNGFAARHDRSSSENGVLRTVPGVFRGQWLNSSADKRAGGLASARLGHEAGGEGPEKLSWPQIFRAGCAESDFRHRIFEAGGAGRRVGGAA